MGKILKLFWSSSGKSSTFCLRVQTLGYRYPLLIACYPLAGVVSRDNKRSLVSRVSCAGSRCAPGDWPSGVEETEPEGAMRAQPKRSQPVKPEHSGGPVYSKQAVLRAYRNRAGLKLTM